MLSEGRLLGHYRLVHRVGRGGMGEVYLAEDTRIDRQVAIKVVHAEIEPYPDPVKMQDKVRLFQREMRVINMLDHPHILPLFDFGEEKDGNMILTYMVMPYRQEGSLVDWLQQRTNSEKLTPDEISHFVTQAADALQHAHSRNLIHQDVKPSNFLVHNRSGNMLPDVLLMDFGTAKMTTATVTASQSIRGTPAFMAPEQWEGRPQPATDQYALAVMAYLLLTGDTPFSGRMEQVMHQHFMARPQPLGGLNPAVSPELDAVILRALEKEPSARFPSILEFAQAFQYALQFTSNQGPIVLAPKNAEALTVSADAAEPGKNPLTGSAAPSPTIYPAKLAGLPPTVVVSNPVLSAQAPTVADININGSTRRMLKSPSLAPGASKNVSSIKKYLLQPRILVVLMILVILFSIVGMGIFYQNQTNQANASALANNNATATAQANVTATAQAQANATAQVIAQNPDPYPPNGTLAFVDPLNQAYKWNSSSTNNGACQFINGAYHVSAQQNLVSCSTGGPFSNFAFEVQLTMTQGSDCGGMTFRDDGNGHFYSFSVCQDGSYKVVRSNSNRTKTLKSDSINTNWDQQSNKIAVVANGDTMTFYVNGQQIDQVQDRNYTSGSIGLIADPQNGNATDIAYTNARLWTL